MVNEDTKGFKFIYHFLKFKIGMRRFPNQESQPLLLNLQFINYSQLSTNHLKVVESLTFLNWNKSFPNLRLYLKKRLNDVKLSNSRFKIVFNYLTLETKTLTLKSC